MQSQLVAHVHLEAIQAPTEKIKQRAPKMSCQSKGSALIRMDCPLDTNKTKMLMQVFGGSAKGSQRQSAHSKNSADGDLSLEKTR